MMMFWREMNLEQRLNLAQQGGTTKRETMQVAKEARARIWELQEMLEEKTQKEVTVTTTKKDWKTPALGVTCLGLVVALAYSIAYPRSTEAWGAEELARQNADGSFRINPSMSCMEAFDILAGKIQEQNRKQLAQNGVHELDAGVVDGGK